MGVKNVSDFSKHQSLLDSLLKPQISWIPSRDSDLIGLGWRPVFIFSLFKSISTSDFEKGAVKSFVLPNVESLDEEKDI